MIDTARPGVRRRWGLRAFAFAALLLIGWLVFALLAPRFKKIERRAPAEPFIVQTAVPEDVESVASKVRNIFNDETDLERGTHKLAREVFLGRFYLYPRSHPIFPDSFQIQHWARQDPYLRPYAELPPDKVAHDFYLWEPTGDEYWTSDYYYNGVPAKFRCAFFIHLEPGPRGGTTIAVFEYLPTIWVGERIGFSAHAIGPGRLYDIRPVQSTNRDRFRLLEMIRERIKE